MRGVDPVLDAVSLAQHGHEEDLRQLVDELPAVSKERVRAALGGVAKRNAVREGRQPR